MHEGSLIIHALLMANEPCKHEICHQVSDGTCHIDEHGWLVRVTPEVRAVRDRMIPRPNDSLAIKLRETVSDAEFVNELRAWIADPDFPKALRKKAEAMLERLRLMGFPGDEPGKRISDS